MHRNIICEGIRAHLSRSHDLTKFCKFHIFMQTILNCQQSILRYPYGACCCRFTVGQEIATFLASCGILYKAWEESCLASNSKGFSLNEYEGVAYVSFPSFHQIEGFIVQERKYGSREIYKLETMSSLLPSRVMMITQPLSTRYLLRFYPYYG